ncbi:MAG TPA: hypothetical protein VNX68_19185 [Nitrosopumilaceae archaeon]|jgi:hypothetical protein|nr:hypothetical protein [Nitrosopumilaceae archaeon]
MSHVVKLELEIKDLIALKAAAKMLGMEFREGQKTYNWWGHSVGDYPLPEGFTAKDLGKCEHALSIPDKSDAYEVGVVKRRDNRPGYTLLWDFYGGGRGLVAKIGKDGCKIKQAYAESVASLALKKKGFKIQRSVNKETGKVVLTAVK